MKPFIIALFLLVSFGANAELNPGVSRSAGKLLSDDSIDLKEKLLQSPVAQSELKTELATAQRLAQHPATDIEIFDAWVDVFGDHDYDGFYQNIQVTLDADTLNHVETVYVKLYLSYEGGPWQQYATSDLYEIHEDSAHDSYRILTELIDGYYPGYYSVLIELHSLSHINPVDSVVLRFDTDGYDIALEDRSYDEDYVYDPYDVTLSAGVSGSLSIPGILLFGFLLWIKFRYFRKEG
jgi:hypothetical protein